MTTYTVAYWQTNQSTLDSGPSFTITDTASDISGAFDALDLDTHITQLIVSDNAAVTVSTNQLFVSDTHAISILKNANNSAYTLVVSDTGANITTYLNGVQSNTHVTTIVVASGVVDATIAQLASDSTALANLKTSVGGPQASVTVSDTSAHIHSGWANVAADTQVSSIVISDNTQLSLTATQASQTSAVEKLVYANSTTSDIVLVKDTAAHIEADLGSLETVSSFIASVTVSDNTFETLSATQVSGDLAILEKVAFQSGPASFSVSDSSTNVSANLDALESLSSSITSIAVTDNSPITVSIAQLANDSDALSLITYNSNPISVAVADTGSNISGNLATLEAAIEAASPPITSISVTSGVINTTVTQLNSDSAVFAALTGSYTLNVSDTASNISGALDTLQTFAHNGDISAINVTDSGAIAVTVAQITSDATAISELVDNDTNPYTLAVTDSVAHIQAAFSSLGSNSHIASITFIDATPVLTITASQFINGVTVLGEITNGSFAIDVTGATAAQAATITADFGGLPNEGNASLSIAVSDTAAHIDNNLVALGSNTYVATIAINDSNPLSLTEAQFTNSGDDAGLHKMTGTYTVDVTGATVAQVSAVEGITGLGGTPTLSIAVSDVAANITSAALTSLGSDGKVTSIAVSDSNPLTLTEAQFTNASDDAGLAKMTGAYTVDISGVLVSQVATVEAVTGLGGTPTLSIAVAASGSHITDSALQSLGADSNVTSITVTSGAISLTESQFTGTPEGLGLAKLIGSYTVDVTGVTVAQVGTVEAVTSLGGTPTLSIAVSDLGANITDAALAGLGSDSKVTSISVSDSNPITLTEAQFTGAPEDAGLAKMAGTYTVDVTGVTVAEVSTVEGVTGLGGTPTLSIAVSDAASAITGALSTLGSDSKVTSITVNESNPITLAEATFVSDSAGLAKMAGSYTVDVTGVTVANVSTVEGITLGGTPTLSIAVSDAASAVSAALATLGSDGDVTSIALTGGTITITEANYTSASYDAGLAKMTGSYIVDVQGVTVAEISVVEAVTGLGGTPTVGMDVRDTGANVSAALVSLGSDSKVSDIALTSGVITLTEAQYTNSGDHAGLAKMTGSYIVNVTGVTVAQVSTVEGVTGLGGSPTLSIAVADTGANLTAPKLINLGSDTKVTSIAVTSGAISLTATQFTTAGEDVGLAKMTGAYTVDVTNCGAATVATVEAVSLGGSPTLSIAVGDIGSRFTSARLVSFGADSKVTSIAVTSGPITLTEAQFVATADHAGLAKLIGSYTVDVTGVLVAQLAPVEGVSLPGTPTRSIAISDTGANLSNFELGDLGSDNHVTSIAVTSGALTFNESQFTSSGSGFAKMTGAYTVDVSGVTVVQVSAVEGVSLSGTPTLSIAVSDSGTNITSAALVSLGSDSKVTSIAVSDSSPITLTEAQFVPDSGGLAKLTGAYTLDVTGATVAQLSTVESFNFQGTPTLSITVADTAAHVGNAESTLNADAHVTGISVTDGAANISTYIDQLNGLTNLTHITINDSGILNLTYAQFTSDSHAFTVMTESGDPDFFYNVVGATVAQASDVLSNHTGYIGDGHFENVFVVDNAANVAAAGLFVLGNAGGFQVNDTAANVATHLDGLEAQATNASRHGTFAITLSDPTDNLVVTEAQLTSDATVLADITNSSFDVMVTNVAAADVGSIAGDVTTANANGVLTTMTVSDIGANFTDAALQAIGSNAAVTSATVTSGSIQLTESQFTGTPELAGLAKMAGSYAITVGLVTAAEVSTVEGETLGGTPTLTINVQDTGANLTAATLSTLGADSKVSHISVSSGTITLTESQFTNSGVDAGFGKMNGPYTVAVTGVLASQVAAVEAVALNGSPTLQIAVSDSGGTLTAAELTTLGSDGSITSIATSSPITLTEAQFTNAGVDAGLAKMSGSYTVEVTGVTVAQVSTVESQSGLGGTPTLTIAVADTGADLTAPKLVSLGADSKVTSIAVTSGAISLTTTQFTTSGEHAGLAKMTGSYTVDVMGVGVAMVATVEAVSGLGGTPTLSIAVTDIGARFTSAELVTLGADPKVTSISVMSGVVSLTEAAFTRATDDAGLHKFIGSYTVDVTGVTVAEVATVEAVSGLGGTPTLSIAVSDIAANLTSAALVALGGDNNVTSIAVSSGAISLTEAQFVADGAGLGKLTGAYTVDVTGVSYLQVATVEGISLPGTPTLSIAVSDTGGDLTSSALAALGGDPKVTSIAVTTGAISLTESQFVGDTAGLGKLIGSYAVDVTGVSYLQVSTVEGISLPGTPTLSIAVSDTGGDLTSSALAALGGDPKVTSITVTTGAISLTEAQFAADTAGLAKMAGTYTVDVTGVTVADIPTVEGISLPGTPTLSIAVSDTGTAISGALATLGSDNDITSISVSSGNLSLAEAAFTADTAGLAKMTGSYTVDVTGVTVGKVATVEAVTGLGGTPTLSIAVSDGGSVISGALSSLGSDSDVTSITVSSGNLSLTEAAFTADTAGLGKMAGSYTVNVTGVTVTEIPTVEGVSLSGTPTLSIAVNDTGSAVSGDLSSLGSDSNVTSIALSSGILSLTGSEYSNSNDLTALSKMTGSYTVDVSSATVAEASSVESATYGGTPTLSIAVSDVGSAFTASALVSLGSDGDVTSIAVTSGQISLTETQFTTTADQAGILKIEGSFAVNVTGVTAGQAATVTADFQNLSNSDDGTLSISVSDTAAHVATNAPALNTNLEVTTVSVTDTAAHVVTYLDTLDGVEALSTITLSDATPVLTMTEANFAGGLLALGAIQNASFAIDVTGVLASQAATVASDFQGITFVGTPTLSIAVADNASDVAGDEAALNANSYITSVAVTDTAANVATYLDTLDDVTAPTTIRVEGTTPSLSLTAAQFEGGTTALGEITNSTFAIDVTSASAAQAATIATEFGGLGNEAHATLSIAVSDTALDISNAMTVLEANAYVTSLTISDSNALNIDYAQFNAGSTLLSELTGTATVNVTGVTGQAYGSFTDTYISGTLAETVDNNTNGSTSVIGYANNLTITAVGPSSHVESITTTGAHGDTFVFTGSFGNDSVTGFNVANDSIEFSHTEFANVAAVEQHTTQVNGNAVVTLDSGDTITFVGVSMNSFEAHATDWSFI